MLIKNWTTEFNEDVYRLEQICFEYPWNKDMVEETASGDNFSGVVAVEDGKTVGYAGAVFALDVADIALVAVAPDYTRRGFAFALVNKLCENLLARGVEYVYLEVRRSNFAAIALYTKCGFAPVGIRKKYYENAEDAIVMMKRIKD